MTIEERIQQQRDRILDIPDTWEKFYEREFCDKVARWWRSPEFFWKYLYKFMTPEEQAHLDEVNPLEDGRRKYKVHQFIEPETKERLQRYADTLYGLVMGATTKSQFQHNFYRRFPNPQPNSLELK